MDFIFILLKVFCYDALVFSYTFVVFI
jgi:hypothetical protein